MSDLVKRLRVWGLAALELPGIRLKLIKDLHEAADRIEALERIAGAMLNMIEDSLDGRTGRGHDMPFVRGVSDLELTPDGSVRLSEARRLLQPPGGDND